MKTLNKNILFLASMMFVFAACNQQASDETTTDTTAIGKQAPASDVDAKLENAQKLLDMLPSPLETASLLKKAGAEYNMDILNSVDNVSKYESTSSRALNLGIYGSDLSYTSIFDRKQEQILYIKAAKQLADDLGITNAFNQETMKRIEKNINSKDSMLNIISESYWVSDAYLKENQRASISALIIAGGWIEGLYIATQLIDNESPNQEIVKRISEQTYSLNQLINLVKSYKQDKNLEEVLNHLNELRQIYDQLEVSHGETTVETKGEVTTIGSTTKINMSDEQLSEIIIKVEEIRNSYIK